MSDRHLKNVVEAALLAAGRSLSIADLGLLFEETSRPDTAELRGALAALAAEYEERGIELKETASGVRIQVRREFASEVSRLWPERAQRYSRASLETLALIAYRQPITRGEIEAVRGVAVNPNILKTLLERNWIRVVGQRDVPGRPELLGTTRDFLDHFGLKSIDELPPLAELRALADINMQLPLPGTAETGPLGDEPVLAASLDELAEGDSVAPRGVQIADSAGGDDEGSDPEERDAAPADAGTRTGLVASAADRDD